MCRKNQLCGCALIAFGLGLLVGTCLEATFFCTTLGLGIMALGFWCNGKKIDVITLSQAHMVQ